MSLYYFIYFFILSRFPIETDYIMTSPILVVSALLPAELVIILRKWVGIALHAKQKYSVKLSVWAHWNGMFRSRKIFTTAHRTATLYILRYRLRYVYILAIIIRLLLLILRCKVRADDRKTRTRTDGWFSCRAALYFAHRLWLLWTIKLTLANEPHFMYSWLFCFLYQSVVLQN